jgi:hypothetical protein
LLLSSPWLKTSSAMAFLLEVLKLLPVDFIYFSSHSAHKARTNKFRQLRDVKTQDA